ncbi:MAG: MFS transporter [Sporomusaceae bacterium]|nr:MFS transporter [Sporomusaceae bacterium]
MTTKKFSLQLPLLLLALGHLTTDLSQGALPVLLPFLKDAFSLTYAQVGYIVLTQNITSSVIQPIFGYLTDKISMPWLIPCGVLLSGIGMSLTGYTPSYTVLLLVVTITGLGVASFHPQASKTVHFISSPATKGRNQGIFSVGGNFGMALGSLFMTFLLATQGSLQNTAYFLLPAGLLFPFFLYMMPRLSAALPKVTAGNKADKIEKQPLNYGLLTILLIFIFIRSSIHTGLTTYIPLYYVNYLAGDPIYASYLVSIFLMAGVAGTYFGGLMSDKYGRKKIILFSMIASLPLIAAIPYTSGIITILLVGVAGAVLISSFATTIVLAQEMMPGRAGMAAGLTIGFSIGLGGFGTTIMGYVADHFGVPSVFTVLSVLPLAGFLFASFLPGTKRSQAKSPA